jgi:hypothetical protein
LNDFYRYKIGQKYVTFNPINTFRNLGEDMAVYEILSMIFQTIRVVESSYKQLLSILDKFTG